MIPLGLDLFVRTWVPGDPRTVAGDGLGPRFNDFSCAACHAQGGVGGAGASHADVRLFIPSGQRAQVEVLHRYGAVSSEAATARRNTTALFGAGLLDALPEEVLLAAARDGSPDFPEITGRAAVLRDQQVGRFGWKADTASLEDFVVRACAVELGLESWRTTTWLGHEDLGLVDVTALTAFVADLPRPIEVDVPGAERGRLVFRDVGCAACHVERLGAVDGVFGDLLLHDLGSDLADRGGGYYGAEIGVARAAEWRTPPLWGLRDSAPYLHDGRATTLGEAIEAHGGEASRVVDGYLALTSEDAAALSAFLLSLAAPL